MWIPYNGLFFAFLGRFQEFQAQCGMPKESFALDVANAAAAAAVASWATTPIDVVKTRVQVQGANPELFDFKGPVDCVRQLVQREGVRALFSGASGRVMYMVPNMALFIPIYEQLKRMVS